MDKLVVRTSYSYNSDESFWCLATYDSPLTSKLFTSSLRSQSHVASESKNIQTLNKMLFYWQDEMKTNFCLFVRRIGIPSTRLCQKII